MEDCQQNTQTAEMPRNAGNEQHFPEIFSHPAYRDIENFGLGNSYDRLQAYHIFMDLCECKRWWGVRVESCPELQKVIISGHESRTADRAYIVPVLSNGTLSHADIQKYVKVIQAQHNSNSVILALVDDNSSIVYYRATDGLVPPDPPDRVERSQAKAKRVAERRRRNVQLIHQREQRPQAERLLAGAERDQIIT